VLWTAAEFGGLREKSEGVFRQSVTEPGVPAALLVALSVPLLLRKRGTPVVAERGERGAVVRPDHDRMPAIRPPEDFAAWLDPRTPAADLHALLRPYPAEGMASVPVGGYVSNPRNEGSQCSVS
jgi:hypothetical protein